MHGQGRELHPWEYPTMGPHSALFFMSAPPLGVPWYLFSANPRGRQGKQDYCGELLIKTKSLIIGRSGATHNMGDHPWCQFPNSGVGTENQPVCHGIPALGILMTTTVKKPHVWRHRQGRASATVNRPTIYSQLMWYWANNAPQPQKWETYVDFVAISRHLGQA